MATLREVYDAVHPEMNAGTDLTLTAAGGRTVTVHGRCHYSFDTNTRFASYYVDAAAWQFDCIFLVNNPDVACEVAAKNVDVTLGNPARGVPMQRGADLNFAGRLYLYVDALVDEHKRSEILTLAGQRGLSVELRDLRWLGGYNDSTRPLAFLSHDSRDKDDVARPLVGE